jgi:carboxymethylenebutenolidase
MREAQSMVDIDVPAFIARPTAPPPWPGVIVVHEGNGITPQLLRFAQRLAHEGFATCAPDLFFRSGGSEATDYGSLVRAVTPDDLRQDLVASVETLRSTGASRVGITGFCFGGSVAYRAALWSVGVDCAASFYGTSIPSELGATTCPVLLFFGEKDPYVDAAAVDAVRAHHGDDVVVYQGADHGFMRDGSPSYEDRAASDAWERLLGFLRANLQ